MNGWLQALVFFLPAGIANATPVFANKIPIIKNWRTPLDFGLSWRKQRLLGANKTWRGFITGCLAAILTGWLVYLFGFREFSLGVWLGLSLAMGAGALLGDAIESSIKRRRGIAAGHRWFPFDQLDYIAGGLLISYPFHQLDAPKLLQITILYFGLHLVTAYTGYLLGLKDKPI